MIRSREDCEGVAPPNVPYVRRPSNPLAIAWRWVLRLAGQLRRQYLCRFRPDYVAEVKAARRGECRRCGSCCDLTFRCPFLEGSSLCTCYDKRASSCREFPIDAVDLRLTRVPCGHYYDSPPEDKGLRIPLAEYGLRELLLFGGAALAGAVVAAVWAWYLAPVFAAVLVFVVAFFRDPARQVPAEAGALVAPADGTVTEIAEAVEPQFLRAPAHKIGIFMSLASVHVNRSPCAGLVEAVEHRPGRFLDARDAAASAENESTAVVIGDAEGRGVRVLVRQVAGVLARRIVCAAAVGDRLERGQRFGMIKFGSRAEVYVPVEAGFDVAVRIGDRAKGGETVLGRFR